MATGAQLCGRDHSVRRKLLASHQALQGPCSNAGASSQPAPARLLDIPGLLLSHRACGQDEQSFSEEFLPAHSFLLLLQVGISKEQGEGANFITTQVF